MSHCMCGSCDTLDYRPRLHTDTYRYVREPEGQTLVALPKKVAEHLRTYLKMWSAYGETEGGSLTQEEVEKLAELFDSTPWAADDELYRWLGV